jgi:Integrase zinc binding domain
MGEYNLQLVHKPGVTNKADLLSHRPDYDQGKTDNEEVLVLPPHLFVNAAEVQNTLEELVMQRQQEQEAELLRLQEEVGIQQTGKGWYKGDALVVPDKETHKRILETYHDHLGAGHPGILKMYNIRKEDYWWPNQRDFVTKYVQGCAVCQSTKSGTT